MEGIMGDLLTRLRDDLAASRKARDPLATMVLGMVLSDVRNREFELRRPTGDDDVVEVVRRGIRKRREAAQAYAAANRDDLAAREGAEVLVLERYVPAAPADDELRGAVQAAIADGATTVGAVMSRVMPVFEGRADGARLNALAREELARTG
jgi:uncharacterized protein